MITLIITLVLIFAYWVYLRLQKPYQFRVKELDGKFTLQRRHKIFFFWSGYLRRTEHGNIYNDEDYYTSWDTLKEVEADLQKYLKYGSTDQRVKYYIVKLIQEDENHN